MTYDKLPRRDRNHEIESAAVSAFESRIAECGVFLSQGPDLHDYGSDRQIEVINGNSASNARVHVQIKGTEKPLNRDGSLSISVPQMNLNYLLMHVHSFYACYHLPTKSLRFRMVDAIVRDYERRGNQWTDQETITVSFVDELTVDRLQQIARIARTGTTSSRDRRIEHLSVPTANVGKAILQTPVDVHVPDDPSEAAEILQQLLEKGADDVISRSFSKFEAVLGKASDSMMIAYMAEINLGMAGQSQHPSRLEDALVFFQSRLGKPPFHSAGLNYTIGNAYSALRNEAEAKTAYEAALADPETAEAPGFSAQVNKNLGTSLERLGHESEAIKHYQEALRLNPQLPEAHNAVANHFIRLGKFADALTHLDQIVFAESNPGKTASVMGWRANVLFNLDEGRAAFRDVNTLVAQADAADWIWPWCARLIASFGRASEENARQALAFWKRYVRAFPDHSAGHRELVLTELFLQDKTGTIGMTYAEFRTEFERHVQHVDVEDAALLWDRLGHWAQREENWEEAEKCFRRAYKIDGGHYGYCLGTALNYLSRFEESLPLLLEQAEEHQPDAMSWFQVAVAREHLQQLEGAIQAYKKAVAIDPDYALAAFNLGGLCLNTGNSDEASRIWKTAVGRFPEHELAAKIRQDFPHLL